MASATNTLAAAGAAASNPIGTVIGVVAGLFSSHPKDAQRAKEAQDNLVAARNGSQAALDWIIGQTTGSADDFGKNAYKAVYQQLKSEGRIAGDGKTLITAPQTGLTQGGKPIIQQIADAFALPVPGATPTSGSQASIASGTGSFRMVLILAVLGVLFYVGVKLFAGRR